MTNTHADGLKELARYMLALSWTSVWNIHASWLCVKHFSYREKTESYEGILKTLFHTEIIRNDFVTLKKD